MRILLIHPNYHSGGAEIAGNWPPAWAAYLTGALKAAGYCDIRFIDAESCRGVCCSVARERASGMPSPPWTRPAVASGAPKDASPSTRVFGSTNLQHRDDAIGAEGGRGQGDQRQQHAPDDQELAKPARRC